MLKITLLSLKCPSNPIALPDGGGKQVLIIYLIRAAKAVIQYQQEL